MPNSIQRSITTSDGRRLSFQHWPVVEHAKGVVVCLHGIQSHAGWYELSSQQLADSGYEVYFADRRGSGANGFQRGHADHGKRLLHDVRQLIRLVRQEHPSPNIPLTVLGISWGGKIAAALAATYPELLDQLVLMCPGLCPRIRPNRWQNFQLNFARRHDLRHKQVPLPLGEPTLFTAEKSWQEFIQNDPLAIHFISSGLLNSGRDLDRLIAEGKDRVTQPTFLMLAGQDRIIDNIATRRLVGDFPSNDLTIKTYSNTTHTLEFEPTRNVIINDLQQWFRR